MSNESTSEVSKPLGTSDLDTETGQEESVEVGLVRDAQSGDPEAFAELVRRYQRRAVSLAYRLLGNIEDAGDVSQEAFIRAYRHLSQLDDPSRFGAWFLRVVSNLSLNYRRSRKSRSAVSLDDVEAVERAATFRSGGFPRRLKPAAHFAGGGAVGLEDGGGPLADELHEAITQALERLPDKQRLALLLFSVEGLPQKQVADILECSVELVKWNVFQARQKLKEMLKDFF